MADIRIAKPAAGISENIPSEPGARFIFDFPTTDATLFRDGDNLVISFPDGSQASLQDFYSEYDEENLPSFVMDDVEVAARDFFTAMNEPDLMPAAGPATGADSAANARYHAYDDMALAQGIDHLWQLDWNMSRAFGQEDEFNSVGYDVNEYAMVNATGTVLDNSPVAPERPATPIEPVEPVRPVIPESPRPSEPDRPTDIDRPNPQPTPEPVPEPIQPSEPVVPSQPIPVEPTPATPTPETPEPEEPKPDPDPGLPPQITPNETKPEEIQPKPEFPTDPDNPNPGPDNPEPVTPPALSGDPATSTCQIKVYEAAWAAEHAKEPWQGLGETGSGYKGVGSFNAQLNKQAGTITVGEGENLYTITVAEDPANPGAFIATGSGTGTLYNSNGVQVTIDPANPPRQHYGADGQWDGSWDVTFRYEMGEPSQDHNVQGVENDVLKGEGFEIPITSSNAHGDATGKIAIEIYDDGPRISNGQPADTSISGADGSLSGTFNGVFGADGRLDGNYITVEGEQGTPTGTGWQFDVDGGKLLVTDNHDGTFHYEYTPDNPNLSFQEKSFNIQIIDGDNDTASSSVTVNLNYSPEITNPEDPTAPPDTNDPASERWASGNSIVVDEAAWAGKDHGTGDTGHGYQGKGAFNVKLHGENGDVKLAFGDQEVSFQLDNANGMQNLPANHTINVDGVAVTITDAARNTEGEWTINYTYDLTGAQTHTSGGGNVQQNVLGDKINGNEITITVKDSSGDEAVPGAITVEVHDDGPIISGTYPAYSSSAEETDSRNLGPTEHVDFTKYFDGTLGKDNIELQCYKEGEGIVQNSVRSDLADITMSVVRVTFDISDARRFTSGGYDFSEDVHILRILPKAEYASDNRGIDLWKNNEATKVVEEENGWFTYALDDMHRLCFQVEGKHVDWRYEEKKDDNWQKAETLGTTRISLVSVEKEGGEIEAAREAFRIGGEQYNLREEDGNPEINNYFTPDIAFKWVSKPDAFGNKDDDARGGLGLCSPSNIEFDYEIGTYTDNKANGIELDLGEKLAYGINVNLGSFFGGENTISDFVPEKCLLTFYKDGKIVKTHSFTSAAARGDEVLRTGDIVSGGFDKVIICPIDCYAGGTWGGNSNFTLRGFDLITLPQHITSVVTGKVNTVSGADGYANNAPADIPYARFDASVYADKVTVQIGEETQTATWEMHTFEGSSVLNLVTDDGKEVLLGAILDHTTGKWTVSIGKEDMQFQDAAGNWSPRFNLSFVTEDADGDKATLDREIDLEKAHNSSKPTENQEGGDAPDATDSTTYLIERHSASGKLRARARAEDDPDTLVFGDGADRMDGMEEAAASLHQSIQELAGDAAKLETLASLLEEKHSIESDTDNNDILTGGSGNDVILAQGGDDYIDGGAGRDVILAGSGNDIIVYDQNDAAINGGSGIDLIIADMDAPGLDQLIEENAARKQANAPESNGPLVQNVEMLLKMDKEAEEELNNIRTMADVAALGIVVSKNDILVDTDKWEQIVQDNPSGKTVKFEGTTESGHKMILEVAKEGDHKILTKTDGDAADNILEGDDLANIMHGMDGDDQLFGGLGDDKLYGDAGNDYLDGGEGRDWIDGGEGADIILLDPSDYLIDGGDDEIDFILSTDKNVSLAKMLENGANPDSSTETPMVRDVEVLVSGNVENIKSVEDLADKGIHLDETKTGISLSRDSGWMKYQEADNATAQADKASSASATHKYYNEQYDLVVETTVPVEDEGFDVYVPASDTTVAEAATTSGTDVVPADETGGTSENSTDEKEESQPEDSQTEDSQPEEGSQDEVQPGEEGNKAENPDSGKDNGNTDDLTEKNGGDSEKPADFGEAGGEKPAADETMTEEPADKVLADKDNQESDTTSPAPEETNASAKDAGEANAGKGGDQASKPASNDAPRSDGKAESADNSSSQADKGSAADHSAGKGSGGDLPSTSGAAEADIMASAEPVDTGIMEQIAAATSQVLADSGNGLG